MIYYFDASALVKAFSEEKGSKRVIEILNRESPIYSSVILYPETLFALRRKREEGELLESEFQEQVREFQNRWEMFQIVELHVFWFLQERILQYPLKALDGIHLASALWVKEEIDECRFVTSDLTLLNYSKNAGLEVLNPEED